MEFVPARLPGVFLIKMAPREDARGFLVRTYCEKEFAEAGISDRWVQCNHTGTLQKGSVRGMHYQAAPLPEAKLVRCLRGTVLDVVVDLRKESATFGHWEGFELSEDKPNQLYIPEGFAHGFQCLTENCHLFYQMSEFYHPDLARGVRWDDPEIGISWPLPVSNLSERDERLPLLKEVV